MSILFLKIINLIIFNLIFFLKILKKKMEKEKFKLFIKKNQSKFYLFFYHINIFFLIKF
jgi:hypothetical protein